MSALTQALVDAGFSARRADAIEAAILGATPTALTDHINDTSDAHDASAVSYDNATSGLTATDAQTAIDEVEGRVDTLEAAPPGLVLLNSGTVTNAATLPIVLTSFTAYRGFRFVLSNFIPVTDVTALAVRLSTDGGSNYDSGASDYSWLIIDPRVGALADNVSDAADSEIEISRADVSNVATEGGISVQITLMAPSAAAFPKLQWDGVHLSSGAATTKVIVGGGGFRHNAQDTNAVLFFFQTGAGVASDIASGNWALYGYA
jgi:hypothetical protein